MAPIWVRTNFWTSLKSWSEGMAEVGWSGVERVTKANGRWPLSASGTPTTQHSAMMGWEEMACSIEPIKYEHWIRGCGRATYRC
jgi:hypothetical protein